MRIALVSDVHLEFYTEDMGNMIINQINSTDCDVLVIAGDLATSRKLPHAIERLMEVNRPLVYVVGNHEYYGHIKPDVVHNMLDWLRQQHPNFYWLHNEVVVINGLRFAGTPMWHKLDLAEDLTDAYHMNDIHQIENFIPFVIQEEYNASKFLRETPADIVVTHHLPSYKCIDERYKGSPLNKFFANPILETMLDMPRLWLHGHTHSKINVTLGPTVVRANPMGYPHEDARYEELILEL